MADQSNSEIFSNLGATYLAAREARQAGASPFAAMMQGFVGAKGVQERAADPYFALRSTLMRQQSEALNLNLANLVTQREIELQQRKGLAEFNSEFSKAMADGTVGDPSTISVLLDTMGKYGIPYQAVKPALDQVKAAGDAKQVQKFNEVLATPVPTVGETPTGVPFFPTAPIVKTRPRTVTEAMATTPLPVDTAERVMANQRMENVAMMRLEAQKESIAARISIEQAKQKAKLEQEQFVKDLPFEVRHFVDEKYKAKFQWIRENVFDPTEAHQKVDEVTKEFSEEVETLRKQYGVRNPMPGATNAVKGILHYITGKGELVPK